MEDLNKPNPEDVDEAEKLFPTDELAGDVTPNAVTLDAIVAQIKTCGLDVNPDTLRVVDYMRARLCDICDADLPENSKMLYFVQPKGGGRYVCVDRATCRERMLARVDAKEPDGLEAAERERLDGLQEVTL